MNMEIIRQRVGRRRNKRGVTVNIYEQGIRPIISKSITIHGLSVSQIYEKILFLFSAYEKSKDGKIEIIIEVN